MHIEAFLSSSFSGDDRLLISKFIKILKGSGVEPIQAQDPPLVPEYIIKMITQRDLFCAVLTNKSEGIISSAVAFEVGVALSHKKNVIVFRESGVPVQSIYPATLQKEFDRAKVEKDDQDEIKKLKNTTIALLKAYGYDINALADKKTPRTISICKRNCSNIRWYSASLLQ